MDVMKLRLLCQLLRAPFERLSVARVIWLSVLMLVATVVAKGWSTPGGLELFDEPGSAADWVAAIGTWVVGLAAFVLASGDRRLRMHERREQKMLRLKLEISQVRTAIVATDMARDRLNRPLQYLTALKERPDAFNNAALYDVGVAFSEILNVVEKPYWSSEERAMATDAADTAVRAIMSTESVLIGQIKYINDNFMHNARNRPASENEGSIRAVGTRLEALDGALRHAGIGLLAKERQLGADRERLAARLNKEFEEML